MPAMGKFRLPRVLSGTALLLIFSMVGCSRQGDFRADGSASPNHAQDVPFHQDAPPTEAADRSTEPASSVPFKPSLVTLPAGLMLTVRLDAPLLATERESGKAFSAVIDAPVSLDGNVVLARGTTVRGRVSCVHRSKGQPGAGHVCLMLDAVVIGGRVMPLQTSSLFARGGAEKAPAGGDVSEVYIKKDHRLTFRLSSNAVLAGASTERASSDLPKSTE